MGFEVGDHFIINGGVYLLLKREKYWFVGWSVKLVGGTCRGREYIGLSDYSLLKYGSRCLPCYPWSPIES